MEKFNICSKCKINKPFSDFYLCKSRAIGIRNSCKARMDLSQKKRNLKNPFPARKAKLAYKSANRDKERSIHLRYRFGITLEYYNAMLHKQGGVYLK